MGIRWPVLLVLEIGEVVFSERNNLLLEDGCLVWRGHKSEHHWSQLGGNWLMLVRDVVTHQVPRHEIWLAKARFATSFFWTCLIFTCFLSIHNVLWFYFMVVKLSKAESEISWRGLPALECLPSAQCLQLERNSGMSLSPRLPARQFSLSLIARAIDWNNCRGDLQLLVGGIWRR